MQCLCHGILKFLSSSHSPPPPQNDPFRISMKHQLVGNSQNIKIFLEKFRSTQFISEKDHKTISHEWDEINISAIWICSINGYLQRKYIQVCKNNGKEWKSYLTNSQTHTHIYIYSSCDNRRASLHIVKAVTLPRKRFISKFPVSY